MRPGFAIGIAPGWRLFRIISRIIEEGPLARISSAAGLTDATSNWGFSGIWAYKLALIQAIAENAAVVARRRPVDLNM